MQGILLFCHFLGYIRGAFNTVKVSKGQHKFYEMHYYVAIPTPRALGLSRLVPGARLAAGYNSVPPFGA